MLMTNAIKLSNMNMNFRKYLIELGGTRNLGKYIYTNNSLIVLGSGNY